VKNLRPRRSPVAPQHAAPMDLAAAPLPPAPDAAHPPIRRLIATFGLWLTGALLAGFTLVMTLHELNNRHHELKDSLRTVAGIIATNSEAAVMFASDREANDILASLRASPDVLQARLFTPDGLTLGAYNRDTPEQRPDTCHTLQPDGQGWLTRWCGVAFYLPVQRHGERVGTLALEAELRPMYLALARSVGFSMLVALLAFGLSVLLWRRVAARIADPLAELVDAALHVWRHEDFERRASAAGAAEVVALSSAFNRMMEQLQQRDVRLHHELGQRRQAEARLNDLAYFDNVTGLHNRHYFMERISQALARAGTQDSGSALIYIDLDGFKRVNDTLGHDQGDALLRMVGERLQQTLRGSDVICRLGGDEFAVILEQTGSRAQLEVVAGLLVDVLSQPYALAGGVDHVSASLGVCTFPEQASEREPLLRRADQAMYQAKQAGKRRYHFYAPKDDAARSDEPASQPKPPRSAPRQMLDC